MVQIEPKPITNEKYIDIHTNLNKNKNKGNKKTVSFFFNGNLLFKRNIQTDVTFPSNKKNCIKI